MIEKCTCRIIPFVVLKGIKEGNKFFTSHDGTDPTKLANGEVAYEVLGFANTVEEAQKILWPTREDRDIDLSLWMAKTIEDMRQRGIPVSLDGQRQLFDIALSGED